MGSYVEVSRIYGQTMENKGVTDYGCLSTTINISGHEQFFKS